MSKKTKQYLISELKSAGYTALATFIIVIITNFANSTAVNWDGAAVISVLLIAARSALKVFIPFLTNLINVKK
jgi:hypothetical protein